MRWAAGELTDVPLVPTADADDFSWHPLQHFFGLTAFGVNLFVATRNRQTLVAPHDERASGQQELYLVWAGEVEFALDGEKLVAARGTAVAVPEPAVVRGALGLKSGAALLVVGCRAGCFESTWNASNFAGVPRAGGR